MNKKVLQFLGWVLVCWQDILLVVMPPFAHEEMLVDQAITAFRESLDLDPTEAKAAHKMWIETKR